MFCSVSRHNAGNISPDDARAIGSEALVLALDPGDYGMIAVRLVSGRIVFVSPLLWANVAAQAVGYSGLVLLAEDQFLGLNPVTTKELTWQTASLSGYLASLTKRLEIVHVMPRVWQAEQQWRMRVPVRKQLNRDEGIELALEELRGKIPAIYLATFDRKSLEGCASALGILLWWEALCERQACT